jgi:hypothetical protein
MYFIETGPKPQRRKKLSFDRTLQQGNTPLMMRLTLVLSMQQQ